MLTLYQFPISHFCEKIRWALDYKGLEYRKINLTPGTHMKVITKLAKKSEVPVLKHDQRVIQGSSNIITYLDERYEFKQLTPVESTQKQMAIEWEAYVDRNLGPQVRSYFYYYLLNKPKIVIPMFVQDQPWHKAFLFKLSYPKIRKTMHKFMRMKENTAEQSLKEIRQALNRILERLAVSPYLAGDYFSRADLAAAALLAPFRQPTKYGLNWPEIMPEEIKQTTDMLSPDLKWVDVLYQKYR